MPHLKLKLCLATILISFFCENPAHARGPGSDGGGNAFSSTPEEVEAVLKKMPGMFMLRVVSEAQTRQLLNPKYVEDADLKKVMLAMYGGKEENGSGIALLEDAMATKYVARARCSTGGIETDAKTAHRRNAPICFSTKRLSRFPKDSLEGEIGALAFHELAHHFGFGEALANKFQNYMAVIVKNFLSTTFNTLPNAGWREMRPTGEVNIKTRFGTSQVKCLTRTTSPDKIGEALQGDDVTLIHPNDTVMKTSIDGPVMIGCRPYPPIDCSDYPYVDPSKEGFTEADLKLAGVCKKD